MKDFYDQLNLSRYASTEDIRTVIAQRKFNLERAPFSLSRNASLDRLNAAARVLLNPELRAKYNQEVFHETISPANASATASLSPPPPIPATSSVPPPALPIRSSSPPPMPSALSFPPPLAINSSLPPAIPVNPGMAGNAVPSGARIVCETCRTKLDPGAKHCPVCGTEFPTASSALSPAISESVSFSNFFDASATETPEQLKKFFQIIGWSYARGTIVSADQPYQVEPEFILSTFLIKAAIIAVVAWLAYHWLLRELGFLIFLVIIAIIAAVFMGGLFMLFAGAFFKIFSLFIPSGKGKEKKQVHVRDVRLRDEQLREYIVRFRGELRSGHVAVGDQIEIWGSDRGGTMMARWGYNFRTKSRIWVKYR